eukprot:CAMPEP_0194242916 /NCGR_PEP_ID=MMETSP0158-20130606/8307_1 /TAXON_ID=33649 /ORGANISM="Thalassionema nitzschioides, Strain L26-B" /LENGTH=582 /DNA_ID=CAMNT_0038978103 /DNA_START=24 /DNA_END=1772 /DNA_ORIENTATION=-
MFLLSCLCDSAIDTVAKRLIVENDDDLTPETKEFLLQLDDSVAIVLSLIAPSNSIKSNENPMTDANLDTHAVDLGWKKTGIEFHSWKSDSRSVRLLRRKVTENFSVIMLNQDDFVGLDTITGIGLKVLTFDFFFPLQDSDIMLKDDHLAKRIMDDLGYEPGKGLPVTYNSDFNMQTDESFSRIFFYGMGVVLLVKQKEVSDSEYGPFVVDLPMHNLAVRKLYRRYGARIHFSKDQKVTAIFDYAMEKLVKPGEDGWHKAKMLAKVTVFTLITAREHLIWTHLLVSQVMTTQSILNLPPSHPIRRLLTIFSYGTTSVNITAFNSLIPDLSVLHRTSALEYSAMQEVFDMAFRESDIFEPFSDKQYNPAVKELIDGGKLPYVSQGMEYYEIVSSFVGSWLEKAGDAVSDDQAEAFYRGMKESTKGQKYELPPYNEGKSMHKLLSSIIFTVTAFHELVGHSVDYTILPSRAGFRLTKKDPSEIDFQSFLLTQSISSSTSQRMPALLAPFEVFFGAGGAPSWERDVWNDFLEKLRKQSAKVQVEDVTRVFHPFAKENSGNSEDRKPLFDTEFKYFDPSRFECSVAL